MFVSAKALKERMRSLAKNNPNIEKTIGSYIAEGDLTKNDGVSEPQEKICWTGHFDLHVFEGVELHNRFKVTSDSIR